jgi:uncharacterized protein YdaU (DUF1376 family)
VAKSPAFRFYPADFLGSPDVQSMDLNEIGAYILLLCIAWQQDRHGCLPDDENRLRRWARMSPEQWTISREILLGKFPVVESGLRGNQRMIREAEKQAEFSAKQSNNGKQGGRPRKAVGFENKPVASEIKANENPEPPETKPSVCVSAFVSASVSVLDSVSVSEEKPSTLALTPDGVYAGVFELPLIGNKGEWSVPKKLFSEMVKAYPGVDVMEQLSEMRGWLISNPTRRKTESGLPRFINSWLSKSQNAGSSHGNGKPARIDTILDSTRGAMEILDRRSALEVINGSKSRYAHSIFDRAFAAKQDVIAARTAKRSREQQILDCAQRYDEKIIRQLESQTEVERKTDD